MTHFEEAFLTPSPGGDFLVQAPGGAPPFSSALPTHSRTPSSSHRLIHRREHGEQSQKLGNKKKSPADSVSTPHVSRSPLYT